MSATHRGEVIVTAIGTGTQEDPQRPDIDLPTEGWKWEDVTAVPSASYINPPPNSFIVYVEADEAKFLSLGDDTIWYEEIPVEAV